MGYNVPLARQFMDRYVLSVMAGGQGSFEATEYFRPLAAFERNWFSRDMARAFLRDLTDRGLAQYSRGLWTEDGEPAGSGYAITNAGLALLDKLGRVYLGDVQE